MVNLVFDILDVLILSFNISYIASNISLKKVKKIDVLITTIIIFIPSCVLVILKMPNILVPISLILIFLYYYFNLKNGYYSIFISIMTQIIFALSDGVVAGILVFILKINYQAISANRIISLIGALIIVIVSYGISKIFSKFIENQSFYNLSKMVKKDGLVVVISLIVAVFSIYLYTMTLKNLYQLTDRLIILSNLFFIASILVYITAISYLKNKSVRKDLESKHKELQLYQLKEYTEMLEIVSGDLRNFKHDYANIIQIIGDYLDSKKFDELKDFYRSELMPESKKIIEKDRQFMLLKHIKVDPLKGLISSKFIIAQGKKINIKLEISDDIEDISISLIDICRIIGVLLDNAIEASELCDNKFIEFVAYCNEYSTVFIINNSCSEKVPPIYKIYEKNFSTKGQGRGIGLTSVRSIIDEKYKNVILNTSIEESVFKQELIINQAYIKI